MGAGSGTEDVRLAWGGWAPEENWPSLAYVHGGHADGGAAGRWRPGGDCFVSSRVPLSCRILSKLSQDINKNEERRSIFTRK